MFSLIWFYAVELPGSFALREHTVSYNTSGLMPQVFFQPNPPDCTVADQASSVRLRKQVGALSSREVVLEPFDSIGFCVNRIFKTSVGQAELLSLLYTDQYALTKMMLEILIFRVNHGCIRSAYELSSLDRRDVWIGDNTACILLKLCRENFRCYSDTSSRLSRIDFNKSSSLDVSHLSKPGRAYLKAILNHMLDTQWSDQHLKALYENLSEPLKLAVLSEAYGGGAEKFYEYFETRYGIQRPVMLQPKTGWFERIFGECLGVGNEIKWPLLSKKE